MDKTKYLKLSESERVRVEEIDNKIAELQRERANICRYKATIFDEERDYLASKFEDFYVHGTSKMHRRVRINPKYNALWSGILQASEFKVFGVAKLPEYATNEQMERLKRAITESIDRIYQNGLPW